MAMPAARMGMARPVAGGAKPVEPAVDLGIALAVASAASGVAVPGDAVVCGEVGLAGELRQVGRLDRRMAEAARLGFGQVVVPTSAPDPPSGCRAVRCTGLGDALAAVGISG